jgi:hypothetical protein
MARHVALALFAAVGAAAFAYACGRSLPTPELRAHPSTGSRPVEVPYSPPPARAEVITLLPREGAVWIDGEWSWQAKQWTWESGGWVIPPPGAYFAPWMTYRTPSGSVLYTRGAWYEENGRPLPKPAFLGAAQTSLEGEIQADGGGGPDAAAFGGRQEGDAR